MAEPIVSFLLETIGKLLIEEGKFLSGVSDQAEQLHLKLKMMRALLRDADEKQHESAVVKEWVSQSKDIAYEAEDVLETHAFKLASRRRRSGTMKVIRRYACILNECYIRHKVGSEIQNLINRVSDLTRSFQESGIRDLTEREGSSSRLQQLRMTFPFVADDEDFVGFGPDIEKLVQVLVSADESFDHYGVVSITGMGGSGKTTLARKVYNHPHVKRHFDSFAWVCISQQWQTKDILQGILISFLPDKIKDIETWREGELVEQLLRVQKDKKCLVVLDDIWATDAWDCIKGAFPTRRKDNKILLITRNENVATHIGPNGFQHRPKLLSDPESWELLQRKALRDRPSQEYGDIHNLEELGKEMVKFCGGLPLAVVVLGGILATKHSANEWNAVYKNIKSYLGRGESIEHHQGEVHMILALSYNDLPYKLKPCFLYLSGFSEDEEIDAERLYHLWIAEGMVFAEDRIGEESMVDIAERYLGELAKRCIVHVTFTVPGFTLSFRKFESCRLHDLMRDLCLAKAREEKFLKVTDYRYGNDIELANTTSSSSGNLHRIMIHLSENDAQKYVPPELEVAKHLRTFLFRYTSTRRNTSTPCHLIEQLADFQLNRFQMLKSLTIEGVITPGLSDAEIFDSSIPDGVFKLPIGNLIHLRYLSLRSSTLLVSPSSINNLEHLETLDLCGAKIVWTRNVPLRMRQLRYLDLRDLHDLEFPFVQIYASSNLEILIGYELGNADIRDFSELINLRELELRLHGAIQAKDVEKIMQCISNFQMLKRARILNWIDDIFISETGTAILAQLFSSKFQVLDLAGYLGKLPEYDFHFFRNLVELRLVQSALEEDPMEILEKLPNLEKLWLVEDAFKGKEMVCHSMGFPQLRFLQLHALEKLKKWTVEKGAMPNLSRLRIGYCKRLTMIPEGLKFIKPLKELEIEEMPEEFKNRIRVVDGQKGEDFDKICHIPSILVLPL